MKGCNLLPTLDTYGHWAVRVLLWHGSFIYNGHLRGPVTLTPIAERLAEIRTPNLPLAGRTLLPTAPPRRSLYVKNVPQYSDRFTGFRWRVGSWGPPGELQNFKTDHISLIVAAVTWLKDCRYGVNSIQSINQSINQSFLFYNFTIKISSINIWTFGGRGREHNSKIGEVFFGWLRKELHLI